MKEEAIDYLEDRILIEAGSQDTSRPKERPAKKNWKLELLKAGLRMLQYPFPGFVTKQVWTQFRKPQRSPLNQKQKELVEAATLKQTNYKGSLIQHYQWGKSEKKILLSHGWNSKIADFRKMINFFVKRGYQVEGFDARGHGQSEGNQTGLPEIVDLLHEKYIKEGPYEVVIGYSMGGLGAGLMTAQLPSDQLPKDLILIAAPPYSSYFFKSTIIELGFRKAIYKGIFVRVEETYGTPITDLDIRHQQQAFEKTKLTFVYDENDQTIPFDKGIMLKNLYPQAQFIHTRGLGHYKIIAYDPINELLLKRIIPEGIPNY